MQSTAEISDCGRYRYSLFRRWGNDELHVQYIGLNPSTADALTDDMTVRKCIGFAERLGAHSMSIVNLFAYRATVPSALLTAGDPVGPKNDDVFRGVAKLDDTIRICAWGSSSSYALRLLVLMRLQVVRPLLAGAELWCLGLTKGGSPRHPSRLPYDNEITPFGL